MTLLERVQSHLEAISPEGRCDGCILSELQMPESSRPSINQHCQRLAMSVRFQREDGICPSCEKPRKLTSCASDWQPDKTTDEKLEEIKDGLVYISRRQDAFERGQQRMDVTISESVETLRRIAIIALVVVLAFVFAAALLG